MVYSDAHRSRWRAPEPSQQRRRALPIMVVVLAPLAIWTLGGLIVLRPGNASGHILEDTVAYPSAGVRFPPARITEITEMFCTGMAGSTQDVDNQTCGNITAQLLEPAHNTSRALLRYA